MAERFRFLTAGESHGETLGAIVEGVPAGLALTAADLATDLARRQRGYGRGVRRFSNHPARGGAGAGWGGHGGKLPAAQRCYKLNSPRKASLHILRRRRRPPCSSPRVPG